MPIIRDPLVSGRNYLAGAINGVGDIRKMEGKMTEQPTTDQMPGPKLNPRVFYSLEDFERRLYDLTPCEYAKGRLLDLLDKGFHGLTDEVVGKLNKVEFYIKEMEKLIQKPEELELTEVAHFLRSALTKALHRIRYERYYDERVVVFRERLRGILAVKEVLNPLVYTESLKKDVIQFLGGHARGDCESETWFEAVWNARAFGLMESSPSEKTYLFLLGKFAQARAEESAWPRTLRAILQVFTTQLGVRRDEWMEWGRILHEMGVKLRYFEDPLEVQIMMCTLP